MQSLRIVDILRSLSAVERRGFGEFLTSPYFSVPERTKRFWAILSPYAPAFDSEELSRAQLFPKLFPDTPLDEQKFREEVSMLYRQLKQFLALETLQQTRHAADLLLLRSVRERGIGNIFEIEANALEREIAAVSQPADEDYWAAYQLADERNRFFGQQQVRTADDSLQHKSDALDTYYWLVKLRESCEMLNRNQLLNTQFDAHLMLLPQPSAMPHAQIEPSAQAKIALYQAIYQMLQLPTEKQYFEQVLSKIAEVQQRLERDELRAVYQFAQNHCIRRINAGDASYTAELVRIYRELLESGALLLPSSGQLLHTDYKNAVTAALRSQDFAFAEHIIVTYRQLLAPQHMDSAYHFCLASLRFETGNSREAIKLLQQVQPTDVFYYLAARDLLLKIYYETAEYETLHYLLDAYAVYLKRNNALSKGQKENRLNFIKFVKQLVRIVDGDPKIAEKHRTALLEALSAAPNTTNISWLQAKASIA